MLSIARARWLFQANAIVLITHQIDAAYWREWELFFIPGGNQINLLLNLPIIALVLQAHSRVQADMRSGMGHYKLLAGLGFLTVAIHAAFMLHGSSSFVQPLSITLLAATLVLSSLQLYAVRGYVRPIVLARR